MSFKYVIVFIQSLVTVFLSACVPSGTKYQYIFFEESPVEIVGHGKAEIKSLKSHEIMPIHYHLDRELYKVDFYVDLKSVWPSLFIKGIDQKGQDIYLEGVFLSQCGGFYDYPYRKKIEGKKVQLRYEWSPPFNCPTKEPVADDMTISFLVLGEDGTSLGEETLPFVLRDNGIYFENDAL